MARKSTNARPSGTGPETFYPAALRRGVTRAEDAERGDAHVLANASATHVLVDTDELEQLRAKAAIVDSLSVRQAQTTHELRTPLQSVLGYSHVLDRAGSLNDPQRSALKAIAAASQHLLDLLDDLIVDIESGADSEPVLVVPVDITESVRRALELVTPQAAAEGITIHIETDATRHETPIVLADPHRLVQVLVNLLTNAIKYNHPGGGVTVFWTLSDGSLVGPATVTPRLRLSVSDTGIGISPAGQARLFTAYDRLGAEDTDVEGHGIGLALCRDLLESMNGTIAADSLPGIGSIFTIDLPLASNGPVTDRSPAHDRPAAAAAGSPPAGVPQAAATLRVLNIEDNLANRELIDEVIGTTGDLAVSSTGSGLTGVDLARSEQPDVILLDVHLPDASVEHILDLLKTDARTATIPVIILTADASTALAQHLSRLGVAICLTKPIDLDSLIATIRLVALPRPRVAAVITTMAPGHVLARTPR